MPWFPAPPVSAGKPEPAAAGNLETFPMLCGSYRFHAKLLDDAVLPVDKGAIFRSLFAPALRRVVCAMKQKDCAGCIIDRRCLYPLLFSSPPPANHHLLPPYPRGKIRSTAIPPPFVIEPPETRETALRRGEPFDFRLILFGRSNEHLTHFIQAMGEMGRLGIGRRTEKGHSRFVIDTVSACGETVFDGRDPQVREGDFAEDLKLILLREMEEAEHSPVSALTLRLETPLVGVAAPRREKDLPFPVLMQAVLGRVVLLCRAYGKGALNIDSPGLIGRAGAVVVAAANLRGMDRGGPDRRRDAGPPDRGVFGDLAYEGALGEFLPFLRFCERTHLGDRTAWGMGKIRVEETKQVAGTGQGSD